MAPEQEPKSLQDMALEADKAAQLKAIDAKADVARAQVELNDAKEAKAAAMQKQFGTRLMKAASVSTGGRIVEVGRKATGKFVELFKKKPAANANQEVIELPAQEEPPSEEQNQKAA